MVASSKPLGWKPAHRCVPSPEPSGNDVDGSESVEEDSENDSRSSITMDSGAEDFEDSEFGNDSDIVSNCHQSWLEEMDQTVDRLQIKLKDVRDEKDTARDHLKGCHRRMEEARHELKGAKRELEGAHRKVEEVHHELGEARRARIVCAATHSVKSSKRARPTRSRSPSPRKVRRPGIESSSTVASGSNIQL